MANKSKKGFWAAVVAGAMVVLAGAGHLVVEKVQPKLEEVAWEGAKRWVFETFAEEPLFTQPVYATQYYSDGRDGHTYQVWKLTLKGRNKIRGEIEDMETGNKGLVSGYWRADSLVLSYASESPDRPGFGSFILRPLHPGLATAKVTYGGLALVHECECKEGVVRNGPILMIPAVLTSDRVVPKEVASQFFTKRPVQPDIVWPDDLQKTAKASN